MWFEEIDQLDQGIMVNDGYRQHTLPDQVDKEVGDRLCSTWCHKMCCERRQLWLRFVTGSASFDDRSRMLTLQMAIYSGSVAADNS